MATSARPVAPSKRRGEGQGRTAPGFGSCLAFCLLLVRQHASMDCCSEMLQSPRNGARKQRKNDSPARPRRATARP